MILANALDDHFQDFEFREVTEKTMMFEKMEYFKRGLYSDCEMQDLVD